MKKSGATPGRLVLVATLGAVLVYVLRGDPPTEAPSPVRTPPQVTGTSRGAARVAADSSAAAPLAEILRHDPFGVLLPKPSEPTAPTEAVEETGSPGEADDAAAPASKTETGSMAPAAGRVHLVYRGERGGMAMIDDRIVREGDRFGDATVIEIRGDGVVLEGPGLGSGGDETGAR